MKQFTIQPALCPKVFCHYYPQLWSKAAQLQQNWSTLNSTTEPSLWEVCKGRPGRRESQEAADPLLGWPAQYKCREQQQLTNTSAAQTWKLTEWLKGQLQVLLMRPLQQGRQFIFPKSPHDKLGLLCARACFCKISKAFLIQSAIAVLLLVNYFPFSSHSVREIWSVLGFRCIKVRFSGVTDRDCVSGFVRLHHWECDDGKSKDGQHFLSTCAYDCKVLLLERKNSKVANCLWFSDFWS